MQRPEQRIDGQRVILFGGKGDPWSNFNHHHGRMRCPLCGSVLDVLTNEHAFQAAKGTTCEAIHAIATTGGPSAARSAGRAVQLRDDWDEESDGTITVVEHVLPNTPSWDGMLTKDAVMAQLVTVKFSAVRLEQLRTSRPAILVEKAPWDRYWGAGPQGTGKNMLGRLMMAVRDGGPLPGPTPAIVT